MPVLRYEFDKLLLAGLLLFFVGLAIWLTKSQMEEGVLDWIRGLTSLVLGALLLKIKDESKSGPQ